MAKNLVIVESPAKARTIERYLGTDFRVLASYGHVRDLPENPGKGQLGVDVEHDFAPHYEINPDRKRQLAEIERAAKGSERVYLATDLDREGEAIAWHVAEAIHLAPAKASRVTFSEITEPAIREAFAHPRSIDQDLVDAQQTRRIVDRLVGYTLSPLLSRKVRSGLSARAGSSPSRCASSSSASGRSARSTAQEYWTIEALLAAPDGTTFTAELVRDRRQEARRSATSETADTPRRSAPRRRSRVVDRRHRQAVSKRSPAPPFTTSHPAAGGEPQARLQPQADDARRPAPVRGRRTRPTGTSASSPTCGPTRRASPAWPWARRARSSATATATGTRCPRAACTRPRRKGAQEAHEAIRPTSLRPRPGLPAGVLDARGGAPLPADLAARAGLQMADKELETTTVDLAAGRTSCARARRGRCSTASPRSTPRASTTPPRTARERTLPALAEGDVDDASRDVTPDPALHRAAAALHRGDA